MIHSKQGQKADQMQNGTTYRTDEITLRVREIHQTSSIDHVVIFDAVILLIPNAPIVEVNLVSISQHSHCGAKSEDTILALSHISDGITEVLSPKELGALVQISNLFIHMIDFSPKKFQRYTAQYLAKALTVISTPSHGSLNKAKMQPVVAIPLPGSVSERQAIQTKMAGKLEYIPSKCPNCGSEQVAAILYGIHTPEFETARTTGRVVLAGNILVIGVDIEGNVQSPLDWHCQSCGDEWGTSFYATLKNSPLLQT